MFFKRLFCVILSSKSSFLRVQQSTFHLYNCTYEYYSSIKTHTHYEIFFVRGYYNSLTFTPHLFFSFPRSELFSFHQFHPQRATRVYDVSRPGFPPPFHVPLPSQLKSQPQLSAQVIPVCL